MKISILRFGEVRSSHKRRFVRRNLAPVIFATAGLLGACAKSSDPLPTIVLITLDTTRADHLSLYGYERPTTPRLDELGAESLVFENASPSATWTLPSHASMFTGLDPAEHGCYERTLDEGGRESTTDTGIPDWPAVSDDLPLFTGHLALAGYHLVGAVGGYFTQSQYGFARDFDAYFEPTETAQLQGAELNRWLFEELDRRPEDQSLFLFVNYIDAHSPYDPPSDRDYPFPTDSEPVGSIEDLELEAGTGKLPSEARLRLAKDLYDRELLIQDEAFGALIDKMRQDGLLENALIIVTSDHGELFGEHSLLGHGAVPYEEVARVPLVVHHTVDGVPQAIGRVTEPISASNVAATVLDTLGLPRIEGNERRVNLLDLPESLPPVFVEHRGLGVWLGVFRDGPLKFTRVLESEVLMEREFLCDLSSDPNEATPMAVGSAEGDVVGALRNQFDELQSSWREEPEDLSVPTLTPEQESILRSLGYVGDD